MRARHLSRLRSGLLVVGVLGLSLGVAACGGNGDETTDTASSVTAKEVQNASGELTVLGWQFYEDEKAQDDAVTTDWTYVNTEAEFLNKLPSGSFDISTPASPQMSALEALGVLQPFDTSLLANYGKIDPILRDNPVFKNDGGEVVAVPFTVLASFLAFDSSQVAEPASLDDLLSDEFSCGIAMFDAPETIAQIAREQGVEDTTEMTQEQLDEAMAYLEELRPNVKAFFGFGEDTQLYNRGDICASYGSFGTTLSQAVENNPAIEWNFVGQNSFIDAWSYTNPDVAAEALHWIDRTLSTKGQEALVNAGGGYPVNPDALPALTAFGDPVSESLAGLSLEQLLEEAPPAQGFAIEGDSVTLDEATRAWNDYKASF